MTSELAQNLYNDLIANHPGALKTITELSKNISGNKLFIDAPETAFDFDMVLNHCPSFSGHKEKSPDALFCLNDTFYFVEFKEGKAEKEDVRLKIHEAILTLFHYANTRLGIDKSDFLNFKFRYALIYRSKVNGNPAPSFLHTLELTAKHFEMKNLEGLLIERSRPLFLGESILKLLNKASSGAITTIKIHTKDQTTFTQYTR